MTKNQGNEYEETHPTKNCISFGVGISIPALRTICQRFLSLSAVCVACSSCKLGRTWINRQNPTSNLTSLKPERPKVVCPRPWHTRAKTALGVQNFCWLLLLCVCSVSEFVDVPGLHSSGGCEASEKFLCDLVSFMYKGAHLSTPKRVDKDVLPNDCDQTASMSATGLKPPRGCGG